ncbi:MAG: 23S rRNA (adenine(2503)-C(2))-methyltransferase RlmN [Elusimicrobia bacterium]|nr:23S rRNA (adenine(2503)-C(2))-methyltransferase RlmN [Elusimicrobiota bacterium]
MNLKTVEKFLILRGHEKYRLRQIQNLIYKNFISDWNEANVLPKDLKEDLSKKINILSFVVKKTIKSKDLKAVKALFELKDKNYIETVLLETSTKNFSVCASTQVGCAVKCPFCATGKMGLKRNLSEEEITDQLLFWNQYIKKEKLDGKISGVVFMGMGEPFFNYDLTAQSVKKLISPDFFGLASRHISVSTFGYIPGIRKFAKDFPQVNLAISLHAVNNLLRNKLVPLNKDFPLEKLSKALGEYVETTHRKVFIEYVLMKGVNDSRKDAEKLVKWLRKTAAAKYFTINIIPYNETVKRFKASSPDQAKFFESQLQMLGIAATIRKSLGADIQGACGQLAGKKANKLKKSKKV